MIKEKLTYKNKRAVKRILRKQWANGVLLGLIVTMAFASGLYFGLINNPSQTYIQQQQSGYTLPKPQPVISANANQSDTVETEITKSADNLSPLVFGEVIGSNQVVRIDFTAWNITSQTSVAGYDCRINLGPWQTCATPQIYDNLQTGEYTFEVRGIDQDGNVDTTPAAFMWGVK